MFVPGNSRYSNQETFFAQGRKVGVWGDWDNDGKDEPPEDLKEKMMPPWTVCASAFFLFTSQSLDFSCLTFFDVCSFTS